MNNLYSEPYKYTPPEYMVYVDEISINFVNEVKKEFNLTLEASGGRMPNNVEAIGFRFGCDKQVTISEARWLLLTLKQRLVEKVNLHEKIRPFLAEYPFPPSGADISISFQANADRNAKNVEFVHEGRNKVFYCQQKREVWQYDDLLVESYQDALKTYDVADKPVIFKNVM